MTALDTIAGAANPGTLYGIGVGPGDARYVTLRAAGLKTKFSVQGWTREDPDADTSQPFHHVGVAFDAYGEREALLLHSFIHEQLLESAMMRPGKAS